MRKILLTSLTFCAAIPSFAQEIETPASEKADKTPRKTIQVRPASMTFHLDRWQTHTLPVSVTNNKDRPYSFRVYLEDFTKDSSGQVVYLKDSNFAKSCKQWIVLDKNFVEVPPHSKQDIMVKMTIPDDDTSAREMRWTMLYVESVGEKSPPKSHGEIQTILNKAFRIGAIIQQIPPTAAANKELKMLGFEKLADGFNNYRIIAKNTGAAYLRCKFSLEISSVETGEKYTYTKEEVTIYPSQVRYYDFQIPITVKPGKYTAIALIDAGDDNVPLEAAQTEITLN